MVLCLEPFVGKQLGWCRAHTLAVQRTDRIQQSLLGRVAGEDLEEGPMPRS